MIVIEGIKHQFFDKGMMCSYGEWANDVYSEEVNVKDDVILLRNCNLLIKEVEHLLSGEYIELNLSAIQYWQDFLADRQEFRKWALSELNLAYMNPKQAELNLKGVRSSGG